jgi:hypothetical protein
MKNTTRLRWLGIAFGIFVSIAIAWWSYDRYLWPWWYVRGHWYFEERRAERLVREDPSKVENWGLLGCARYWTGDAVGSLDAYHHAWQLDTNNVDFTYAVAYAMLNAGHRDDAELWFSNIVTMSEQRGHPEWELNATNNLLFFQEERNR